MKESTILSVPLARRPRALTIALAAASVGLFLVIVGMAELPSQRRFISELMLIAPILIYAAAGLRKLVR